MNDLIQPTDAEGNYRPPEPLGRVVDPMETALREWRCDGDWCLANFQVKSLAAHLKAAGFVRVEDVVDIVKRERSEWPDKKSVHHTTARLVCDAIIHALSGGRKADAGEVVQVDMATGNMTAHRMRKDCEREEPHPIEECGAFTPVPEPQTGETATNAPSPYTNTPHSQSCNLAGCNGTCGICTPSPEPHTGEECPLCQKGAVCHCGYLQSLLASTADTPEQRSQWLHELSRENAALQSLAQKQREIVQSKFADAMKLGHDAQNAMEHGVATKLAGQASELLDAFDTLSTEGET